MSVTLLLLLALQGAPEPVRAPVVTARITPEAPAIGEPITVELRVRAPAGSEARFPVLPDTGTRIEPLDPRALRDASTSSYLDRTAVYRLIAWDTGTVALTFGDVTVTRDGATQRFPVSLAPLRIRSVLPADSTGRIPRPERAPLDALTLRWRLWVALALLATFAFLAWRRWRQRRRERSIAPRDALVVAREAIEHVRALDLPAAGEPGRHALAHALLLRRYLAARWPQLPVSLTAAELEQRLPEVDFPILPQRVTALVARTESLAYARAPIDIAEAERIGRDTVAIIDDLEQVWAARQHAALDTAPRIKRRSLR